LLFVTSRIEQLAKIEEVTDGIANKFQTITNGIKALHTEFKNYIKDSHMG